MYTIDDDLPPLPEEPPEEPVLPPPAKRPPPPPPPSAAEVAAILSSFEITAARINKLKDETRANAFLAAKDRAGRLRRADKWLTWANESSEAKRKLEFKVEDEFIEEYVIRERLVCKAGCGSRDATDNNFATHLKRDTHKNKLKEMTGARQQSMVQSASAAGEAVAARKQDVSAALLMYGIKHTVPSNIGEMYTEPALRMANFLSRQNGNKNVLPPGGSVERAQARASAMLHEETVALLEGHTGALIADEANTSFASGKTKVLGVAFEAASLPYPIFIDFVFDMDEDYELDPEDAEGKTWSSKAAAHILKVLAENKVSIDQITVFVADNAKAMQALAAKLGLPLINCIPHSLQVVFMYFSKHFKRYTIAIYSTAAFIKAGGGSARIKALTDAGIQTSKLKPKATRWRQGDLTCQYLLNVEPGAADDRIVFERLRDVVRSDISFKVGKVMRAEAKAAASAAAASAAAASAAAAAGPDADGEEEEEDEDQELVICAMPGAVREKAPIKKIALELEQVFEAKKGDGDKRNFFAETELRIVRYFASGLQDVIVKMCANVNDIDLVNVIDELDGIKRRLELGKDKQKHNIVFQHIFNECSFELSEAEKRAYVDKFSDDISKACTVALAKYEELIPKALRELEHRLRYEPMLKPVAFPAPVRARYDADDVVRFFGAVPGDVDLEVIEDWEHYVEKWESIPLEIKKLGIGPFWDNPYVKSLFRDKKADKLRRYAKWWGSRPTSSVAMERIFSIMRSMEGSQRMALSREMIRFELKVKCNRWIAERVYNRTASSLPPLK